MTSLKQGYIWCYPTLSLLFPKSQRTSCWCYQDAFVRITKLEDQIQEFKCINEELKKFMKDLRTQISCLEFELQSLENHNFELQSHIQVLKADQHQCKFNPSGGMLYKFIFTERFGAFIPKDKNKTQLVFFKKDQVARYCTRCGMLGHFASNCM